MSGAHAACLHKQALMKQAVSIARPNLMSLGTCFGKFSKTGKFRLHITALDFLAQYAKFKVRREMALCSGYSSTCHFIFR